MLQSIHPGRLALETILEKVWKQKNPSLLKEIYWPDARLEGLLPDTELSVDELVEMVSQFLLLVDVIDWRIVHDFGDDNGQHYARADINIRMHSTGKTGSFELNNVFRMRDGRPEYAHLLIDGLTFLERTGAIPQGALYIAFAGGSFS